MAPSGTGRLFRLASLQHLVEPVHAHLGHGRDELAGVGVFRVVEDAVGRVEGDELALQHLRHTAEAVFRLHQETGFGHLTIGATDDVHAAFVPMLHSYVRDRLAPRLSIAVGASEPEIVRAALEVERRVERDRETLMVARLRDALGSGKRATSGLAPVLVALNERKVATLLVSNGYIEGGWRCSCGALAVKGPRCPVDGAEMERTTDVVSDAIDAALLEGARVEMCEGNADLDVLGRVGALLRY